MAGELQGVWNTGRTCYFLIRSQTATIWNGSSFVTYDNANYSSYTISAVEQGGSGYYAGTFPPAITPGAYNVIMLEQVGGSAAQTDPVVSQGDVQWNGSAVIPLSALATSGQVSQALPIRIARGNAISGFQIYLKSQADHITPFVSGIVSGQIARNGGMFGPLQSGVFTEMGLGFYRVNLTSGDLDAGVVAMNFQARGVSGGVSDPLPFTLILQPGSGGGI